MGDRLLSAQDCSDLDHADQPSDTRLHLSSADQFTHMASMVGPGTLLGRHVDGAAACGSRLFAAAQRQSGRPSPSEMI